MREQLTSTLTETGFIVADVPDYSEALLKLDEFNPDIAIVDEVLPGGDGKDACPQLHNAFSIPVVLLGKDSTGEACGKRQLLPEPNTTLRSLSAIRS